MRPFAALSEYAASLSGDQRHVRDGLALVASSHASRSEIRAGGVLAAGSSVTASVLQVDTSALDCTLDGKLKVQLGAQNDLDLFTTTGAAGQAIYTDGTTAAGISLGTDETAYVGVIACDSVGNGTASGDNGAALLVAVVNGTASTYAAATAPPSSKQIAAALAASTGVHAGTTGWVWLGWYLWDENSATPQATLTLNRNNHLGL